MNSDETSTGYISLKRDVEAIRIPSGDKITLPAGASVIITQALGGRYTVIVPNEAGLYRINGMDADALGKEVEKTGVLGEGPFDEQLVWMQLKDCYDPEIPVNIVALGLIYGLDITADPNGGQ